MLAIFCFCAAFVVACPGCVLENQLFVHDLMFESHHVMHEQELWFIGTGNGWWYILSRNLDAGMGLLLLTASVVGTAYAAYKRSPGDIIMLAFAIPYYILVGAAVSRYARYEIPMLPVLALWSARLLTDGAAELTKVPRLVGIGAAAAVSLMTLWSCVSVLTPFCEEDTRDRAETWIISNVGHAERIGVPTVPWFYTPPISRFFSLPEYGGWESLPGSQYELSRLVFAPEAPFDSATLLKGSPSVVVMSEYEYYDRLRLHDKATLSYLKVLKSEYKGPIVFASAHPLGGTTSIGGLRCQDLPTDMLYASPTILIYTRR